MSAFPSDRSVKRRQDKKMKKNQESDRCVEITWWVWNFHNSFIKTISHSREMKSYIFPNVQNLIFFIVNQIVDDFFTTLTKNMKDMGYEPFTLILLNLDKEMYTDCKRSWLQSSFINKRSDKEICTVLESFEVSFLRNEWSSNSEKVALLELLSFKHRHKKFWKGIENLSLRYLE